MKDLKKDKLISFRLPEELIKQIDELAEKLELVYIPPLIKNKGYRSFAIRSAIEDTLLRFFGPKDDPDDIESPYYNEMSKILPALKNIRLMKKLDELPEGVKNEKEEIAKIFKKYA